MNLYYIKQPLIRCEDVIVHVTPDLLQALMAQQEHAKKRPGHRTIITDARGNAYGLPLVIQENR